MAPPRVEDPMALLMAKIDEGNKENCRRMEAIQSTMEKMESTVQGLVSDRSDFKKWRPEIERKVVEMAETLVKIQTKISNTTPSTTSSGAVPAVANGSTSATASVVAGEKMAGSTLHRTADPFRRPAAESEVNRMSLPLGGMATPNPHAPWLFGQPSVSPFASPTWSQGLGGNMPPMNFPVFDGSNPKLWKNRCETYFEYYAVPVEMWIRLAIMHFEGPALFWLESMEGRTREMNWGELCTALLTRFGRDQHNLLIRQFYHIFQTGSVSDYIEQFDLLLHQLLAHENHLTTTMVTARFVDGLKDELRAVVIIQRPADLDTTCSLALLQEEVMSTSGRRELRKVDTNSIVRVPNKPNALPMLSGSRTSGVHDERRSMATVGAKGEMSKMEALKAYRKAKGLCFKCGERWGQLHTCSNTVPLHLVEEMWALTMGASELEMESAEPATETSLESVLAISVAAVSGSEGSKTIRLWASIYCQQVLVLVDSGSSASFMDNHLTGVMSAVQPLSMPLQVKVADGRTLWSTHFVPDC
ncbi:uncharacterized protein [Zea mays]|uniref:uncharacterized protein n=1 Tax=Zea mays TaxID=4577 RepID=UPI0009AA09DE|nr:uncharacterized protein LOC109940799 [Zea mays]|eukprot:XP_020396680.1 uncharacterized protein LOC109940799 [Zea mays]